MGERNGHPGSADWVKPQALLPVPAAARRLGPRRSQRAHRPGGCEQSLGDENATKKDLELQGGIANTFTAADKL